jgi:hypothetical protein
VAEKTFLFSLDGMTAVKMIKRRSRTRLKTRWAVSWQLNCQPSVWMGSNIGRHRRIIQLICGVNQVEHRCSLKTASEKRAKAPRQRLAAAAAKETLPDINAKNARGIERVAEKQRRGAYRATGSMALE